MFDFTSINDNTKKPISLDFLFSKVTPIEIFERFARVNIKSSTTKGYCPLHQDKSPSLHIRIRHNSAHFKCFGCGEGGSCLDFVGKMYNLDLNKTINLIAHEFNIVKNQDTNTYTRKMDSTKFVEEKPFEIQVVTKEYSKEGLLFWSRGEIFREDLIKYDILECQEVWAGRDELFLWKKWTPENPIFRYRKAIKKKIYCPLEKDKDKKWLSTIPGNWFMNTQNLDYTKDTVIINKSYKDDIIANKMGYNSVSVAGENMKNVEKPIKWLQNKFKRVIVLFDNDGPGIKSANYLKETFNLELFFIPEFFDSKDLFELSEVWGLQEATEIIKYHIK